MDSYSPRLLRLLRGFTHDDDEAHDLLQELWVRAYERRRRFSGSGTLLGWLWSMARNLALSDSQLRASRARHILDPSAHMGRSPQDPLCATEGHALREAIRRSLLDLPEREREVIMLRMLDGASIGETATRLSCAEGTIKATLHHALKKLREPMKEWTR